MKIRRILAAIILTATLITMIPTTVFADEEGNMGGEGGGMGTGSSQNYWNPGYDGVRIQIVDAAGNAVTAPMDFSNCNYGGSVTHFGLHSKLWYRGITNGNQLITYAQNGGYHSNTLSNMPQIILASGSNIAQIRYFFTRTDVCRAILAEYSLNYEYAKENRYKIVIEPIAYFTFMGTKFAMTATEAAFYDQYTGGMLARFMGNLTHKNQPLALYPERPDLGVAAYGGGNGIQGRETIISKLGIGIVSLSTDGPTFGPVPEDPPEPEAPELTPPQSSYTYRTDTDVYSTVQITNNTGNDIMAEDNKEVEFHITGLGVDKTEKVKLNVPKDMPTLVWIKWHTPDEVGTMNIEVKTIDGIALSSDNIACTIERYSLTPPPDPQARDTNPSYHWTAAGTDRNLSSEWGQWVYTDKSIGSSNEKVIWTYVERGYVYYGAWRDNAFVSNKLYSNSPWQELSKKETEPGSYSVWQTKTEYDKSFTLPEDTERQEFELISRQPAWRYRKMSEITYTIMQQRKWLSWTWYHSWTTKEWVSGYWRYTGTMESSYARSSTGSTRYDLIQKRQQYYYPYSTVYVYNTYSWVSGYYHDVPHAESGSGSGYTVPANGNGYSYNVVGYSWQDYQAIAPYIYHDYGATRASRNGEVHDETYYYRTVYQNGQMHYDEFSDWYDQPITWARSCDIVEDTTKTIYRTRRVFKQPIDTYYYRQRTSGWMDTGSYWYSSVVSVEPITYTTKHWQWVNENITLNPQIVLSTDSRNPTACTLPNGNPSFKSGYGVNLSLTTYIYANEENLGEYTGLQTIGSTFPEFNYGTYGRMLVETSTGRFEFANNPYSRFKSRVHFTPIWYPDSTPYYVYVTARDLWTPGGEVYYRGPSNSFTIQGNVYDDWYIRETTVH